MATGPGKLSQQDLADILNKIQDDLTIIRAELLALRVDFLAHDHGNTGSYVQAAITIRAVPNAVTGTPLVSTGVLPVEDVTDVPVPAAP